MADFEARCLILAAENEALRERVLILEEQLGHGFVAPPWLELTGSEVKMFGALMKRDIVSKAHGMSALYGARPHADEAEEKIVDVFICKMRRKLKPYDISIETAWGQGYYFKPETKQKVRQLLAEFTGEAAA